MFKHNIHNVYKGPDALHKYFDPDFQPPLPLIELPKKLNPFRDDNVRVYAKMMTALPTQNVKGLPGNLQARAILHAEADSSKH